MLRTPVLMILVGLVFLVGGCGPRLSPAELGEIQSDPAELPGADEPYPLHDRLGVVETEPQPSEGEK